MFYLDWLFDHKADFKLLVIGKLGNDTAAEIEWDSARVLCIAGVADVVEFHRVDADEADGATLPGVAGRWRSFPVEYKSGGKKSSDADRRQLAAQALWLTEMLKAPVPAGALYYGRTRRREDVAFSEAFLRETAELAETVRSMLASGISPPPKKGPWCGTCSLNAACLPGMFRPLGAPVSGERA